MKLAIHGSERPHPNIDASYHKLRFVNQLQRKLHKVELMHIVFLEMEFAVHGSDVHPDVASSCYELETSYRGQGKLDEAKQMYGKSLEIEVDVHGTNRETHIQCCIIVSSIKNGLPRSRKTG